MKCCEKLIYRLSLTTGVSGSVLFLICFGGGLVDGLSRGGGLGMMLM